MKYLLIALALALPIIFNACPSPEADYIKVTATVVDPNDDPIPDAVFEGLGAEGCFGNYPDQYDKNTGTFTWITDDNGQWEDAFHIRCERGVGDCTYQISKEGYLPTTATVEYSCGIAPLDIVVTLEQDI